MAWQLWQLCRHQNVTAFRLPFPRKAFASAPAGSCEKFEGVANGCPCTGISKQVTPVCNYKCKYARGCRSYFI